MEMSSWFDVLEPYLSVYLIQDVDYYMGLRSSSNSIEWIDFQDRWCRYKFNQPAHIKYYSNGRIRVENWFDDRYEGPSNIIIADQSNAKRGLKIMNYIAKAVPLLLDIMKTVPFDQLNGIFLEN